MKSIDQYLREIAATFEARDADAARKIASDLRNEDPSLAIEVCRRAMLLGPLESESDALASARWSHKHLVDLLLELWGTRREV